MKGKHTGVYIIGSWEQEKETETKEKGRREEVVLVWLCSSFGFLFRFKLVGFVLSVVFVYLSLSGACYRSPVPIYLNRAHRTSCICSRSASYASSSSLSLLTTQPAASTAAAP